VDTRPTDPCLPVDGRGRMEPALSGAFARGAAAELQAAVEGLYVAFASYPLRDEVVGCSHCVFPDDQTSLHRAPLRELQSEDLSKYSFKAMSTWGDDRDFRHFLPRLFELLPSEPLGIGPECVANRLQLADWTKWPEPEQLAVRRWLHAVWRAYLVEFPADWAREFYTADECLCTIAAGLSDLTPLLDLWESDESVPHLRHIALVLRYLPLYGEGHWSEHPVQFRQFADRMVSPRTLARMERAYFDHVGEPFADEFSVAFDNLRWTLNVP